MFYPLDLIISTNLATLDNMEIENLGFQRASVNPSCNYLSYFFLFRWGQNEFKKEKKKPI